MEQTFWYETVSTTVAEKLKLYLCEHEIEYDIMKYNSYLNSTYHFDVYCDSEVANDIRQFIRDIVCLLEFEKESSYE